MTNTTLSYPIIYCCFFDVCLDKMPMLRDAETGDWIGTFAGHKGAVWSCRLDPAGLLAGTASGDFSVQVWDAVTGSALWEFPHKHIVKTLDFSEDSKRLATGGHEGLLRIYNLTGNEVEQQTPLTIPQRPDKVRAHIISYQTFASIMQQLALFGMDHSIHKFEIFYVMGLTFYFLMFACLLAKLFMSWRMIMVILCIFLVENNYFQVRVAR
jgi:WD40 repeat protein